MTATEATATRREGAKAARRDQLLDAAAELVSDRGVRGFTMEGLGAAAGVSKALPYRHFANAEDALVALYRRELRHLASVIFGANDGAEPGEAMLVAAVHAYFDVVEQRGELLNALAGPGSPLPELAENGARPAPGIVVELLDRAYGAKGRTAVVLAALLAGLVTAGSDSLGRGDAARATVERTTVAAAVGAAQALLGGRA